MKISTIAMAALAAATVAASPAAAQEYVVNGNFNTVSNANQNFQVNPVGDTNYGTVTGWSTASTPSGNPYNILFHSSIATTGNAVGEYQGTGVEYLRALPSNNTGHGNFMALDGDTNVNGTFFQILTGLTVGSVYTLTFDWATGQIASRTGATTEGLNVAVGSLALNLAPRSTPSNGATDWQSVSANFTATSANQTLSFLAIGSPNGLPPVALLDNVSVRAAVPEPATWAMMLLGFGAIGVSMRKRRQGALAAA